MVRCDPPGFEIKYDGIYELPRIGKDIIYTKWNDDGTTEQKVLRWNGREFNLQSAASRRATTPSSSSSSMQNITITTNGVTFTMVAVQGGTFTMGATTEQGNDADDEEIPAHSVTLSDYYIGQTEVTQALWKAVMGNNPSYRKDSNLPVERVSWNDCQQFITKLNQITGRRFRLPTEAEWEYAASGGVRSRGYKYSGSNDIGSVAWYHGNSDDKTHPVGQKQANELGIYDMSGNVYEWCQDWYGYYSDSAQSNPQGPSWANRRVFRGGSWYDGDSGCRVSYRFCYPPRYIPNTHGLRLAL
ncbi:MAG: formylglycine-generating enzyme family protein [Prevotella sp.]|nr:formylglycine-generating enzyme family protein [Prevotella sp.]